MRILNRPLTGPLTVSCESPVAPRPSKSIRLLSSWNHGQTCCAGTRIFVQSGVYDKFLAKFTEKVKAIKVGDPFAKETNQGPQVSQVQFDVRSPIPIHSMK